MGIRLIILVLLFLLGLAPLSIGATSTPAPGPCISPRTPRLVGVSVGKKRYITPLTVCPAPKPKA